MSDEAKAKVMEILADAGITFTVAGGHETKRANWVCDAWQCKFSKGTDVYEFPFYTGIGHRKLSKYDEQRRKAVPGRLTPGTTAYESWEKAKKPVPPHAADVLHTLLLDGDAADMSFRDWCAELGYSDDSIKALNIYNECCRTGETLRRMFTREQREALAEALQDY